MGARPDLDSVGGRPLDGLNSAGPVEPWLFLGCRRGFVAPAVVVNPVMVRLQPLFVMGRLAGFVRLPETVSHKLVYGSPSIHKDDHSLQFMFGGESRPPAEALPAEQELVGGESAFSR